MLINQIKNAIVCNKKRMNYTNGAGKECFCILVVACMGRFYAYSAQKTQRCANNFASIK